MDSVVWSNVVFAEPLWLLALLLLPLVAWRALRADESAAGVRAATVADARAAPPSLRVRVRHLPLALRMLALALGVVALARPQERSVSRTRSAFGVDIILALDTSTSMRALDFAPNRFEAARGLAMRFAAARTSDRVGLVVFAAKAFTQAPLTLDTDFVQRMLARSETGMIEDGTAIGSALATAVARLKDSRARSKVVVLITDGVSNRGEIDPLTAAEIARAVGVRIYAIGVGTEGKAPYVLDGPFGPTRRMVDVQIDEPTLRGIAERTGGRYFRATTATALDTIYEEIDGLEKTALDERQRTDLTERFAFLLLPALLLLLAERVLAATWLRRVP